MNIQNQRELISLLLTKKEFVENFIDSGITKEYFDDKYHLIIKAIEFIYQRDSSLLRSKVFGDWLKDFCNKKSERISHETTFLEIEMISGTVDENEFKHLLSKIVEDYTINSATSAINSFQKDLKEGKNAVFASKKLIDKLSSSVEDSNSTKPVYYDSVSNLAPEFFEDLKKTREDPEEDKKTINTGYKEIDETMVTGLIPGEITLFAAEPGAYKSTLMLNIGYNVWQLNHNVLFIPLEMPKKQFYQKFISRVSKIPFEKIVKPKNLTEEEMKILEAKTEDIKNKEDSLFYIMDAYERAKVSIIRREIEKHIEIFKPKLVVIDYIGILTAERNHANDTRTIQIGNMLKDIRQLGRPGVVHSDGFHIMSGVQLGRDALKRVRRIGLDKIGFNFEDLRESHEYAQDSANIYAQMKDPTQPNAKLLLYSLKARYGKTVFSNGENKAILSVKPEISLIESINDEWLKSKHVDILKKANNNLDDFDLDISDEDLLTKDNDIENFDIEDI